MFLCQHLGVVPEEGVYLCDKMSDSTYKPSPTLSTSAKVAKRGVCMGESTVSEDEQIRMSFPETAKNISNVCIHAIMFFPCTQTIVFVFVLLILQRMAHTSKCYSSSISVVVTCLLFVQMGNTLGNCRHTW